MKTGYQRELCRLARRIAKLASKIYIGRTGNPSRRLLNHLMSRRRLQCLSVLYWANGRDEADAVEMAIIKELGRTSRKLDNGDDGGTGQYANQQYHAIYLAWIPKLGESIRSVGAYHLVRDAIWDLGMSVPLHLTVAH